MFRNLGVSPPRRWRSLPQVRCLWGVANVCVLWYNKIVMNATITQTNTEKIPQFVTPFLWSYDISALDLERDKKRIVINVLNFGTKEATDWLFSVYSKDEIRKIVAESLYGEWSKKSLHYWRFVLGISAELKTARF